MQVVGDPEKVLPLFADMQATCSRIEGREISLEPLERFEFYDTAKHAFAIIRTSDSGPYGCFILKKGVIDLPPL
jgi:L-fucose mutarotase